MAEEWTRLSADAYYWEKLCTLHPSEVCNRTEAVYHPRHDGYLLPVYRFRYLILPKTREIFRMDWNEKIVPETFHPFFPLMVLAYLSEAKTVKPAYTWVSEKDLKGGSTFFRGPHQFPLKALEEGPGRDPDLFFTAGKRLGGSEILYGDKGFALDVFPKVPLAYILWRGDDEFPARVGVLFDSTIEAHLPLDIIWCLVSETTRRLMESSV